MARGVCDRLRMVCRLNIVYCPNGQGADQRDYAAPQLKGRRIRRLGYIAGERSVHVAQFLPGAFVGRLAFSP